MATDDSTTQFFQIAAALIPVFLLAGAITDKLRPPQCWWSSRRGRWRFTLLASAVPLVISAEIFAIIGAFNGLLSTLQLWLVVLVLVGGTVALALTLLWPWLADSWRVRRLRDLSGIAIFGTVALGVGAVLLLRSSIDLARTVDAVHESERVVREAESDTGSRDVLALMAAVEAETRARREAGIITRKQAGRELLRLAELRIRHATDLFIRNSQERQKRIDELARSLGAPRQP